MLLSVSNPYQTYRPYVPGIRLPGGQGQRAGQQGLETGEVLRVNWLPGRRPGLVQLGHYSCVTWGGCLPLSGPWFSSSRHSLHMVDQKGFVNWDRLVL